MVVSKKYVILFLLFSLILLNLNLSQTATADSKVWSTSSPLDTYNRPDVIPAYDILKLEVALWQADLDRISFYIQFKNPLRNNQFNDNAGSWAGILIDTNNDSQDDIVINTRSRTYSINYSQDATATYRNGSITCDAVSWMNLDTNSTWLGFSVSQKCLGLSNKFRIMGYADYVANDEISFDYAPNDYFTVDLGDYYNPKPKVTMAVPTSSSDFGESINNYSRQPDDLAKLSASLRDSVVTLECLSSVTTSTGTAWSIKVGNIPLNYSTYLVTNYHVISDCISTGKVTVITNNGSRFAGVLASWDPVNDLAGIYVDAVIPPLVGTELGVDAE